MELSVAAEEMTAWASISTDGLLLRLGVDEVEGDDRGESCWFYIKDAMLYDLLNNQNSINYLDHFHQRL